MIFIVTYHLALLAALPLYLAWKTPSWDCARQQKEIGAMMATMKTAKI